MKTFRFSLFFIRSYQIILGPYLGGRCRFYPSCSNYAIECFENHNALKATILTAKRLCSCHPLSQNKNYYDPAPHSSKGII